MISHVIYTNLIYLEPHIPRTYNKKFKIKHSPEFIEHFIGVHPFRIFWLQSWLLTWNCHLLKGFNIVS